jgi:AcrR family transcriptional regulator
MAKLAKGRTEYLTPEEITREALRQFDEGDRPLSMRNLAKAMGVAPSSIYHYFASEDAIIRSAVALVYEEAIADFFALHHDQFPEDPVDFLVSSARCLRRAFTAHFRIAPYLAMAPEGTDRFGGIMAVLGSSFERMGFHGKTAGRALYAFGNYVYGSILVSASIRIADERLEPPPVPYGTLATHRPEGLPRATADTEEALDQIVATPGRREDEEEEALFEDGLRMLIAGMEAALPVG